MPGLLRGVARTAAIAGTATAVSNRVSRRQANRWAAQEEQQYQEQAYQQQAYQQQPQYEPAPQPQQDMVQQLKDLAALKDQGVLTEEEFAAQKARILGG